MIGGDLHERHRARLLELLKRLAYENREVILTSGQKSNFYIDCKQAVLGAEGHFLVGWLMGAVIGQQAPHVEAVGGLTMGADPLASAVATVSYLGPHPLQAFYIRKEPKGHGTAQWIELIHARFTMGVDGLALPLLMLTVLIIPLVANGFFLIEIFGTTLILGTIALSLMFLAGYGGMVSLMQLTIGLVDQEEGGREALEREAPLHTLFSRRDFG